MAVYADPGHLVGGGGDHLGHVMKGVDHTGPGGYSGEGGAGRGKETGSSGETRPSDHLLSVLLRQKSRCSVPCSGEMGRIQLNYKRGEIPHNHTKLLNYGLYTGRLW